MIASSEVVEGNYVIDPMQHPPILSRHLEIIVLLTLERLFMILQFLLQVLLSRIFLMKLLKQWIHHLRISRFITKALTVLHSTFSGQFTCAPMLGSDLLRIEDLYFPRCSNQSLHTVLINMSSLEIRLHLML